MGFVEQPLAHPGVIAAQDDVTRGSLDEAAADVFGELGAQEALRVGKGVGDFGEEVAAGHRDPIECLAEVTLPFPVLGNPEPDAGVPIRGERAGGGRRADEDFGASAILMGATRREDKAS